MWPPRLSLTTSIPAFSRGSGKRNGPRWVWINLIMWSTIRGQAAVGSPFFAGLLSSGDTPKADSLPPRGDGFIPLLLLFEEEEMDDEEDGTNRLSARENWPKMLKI